MTQNCGVCSLILYLPPSSGRLPAVTLDAVVVTVVEVVVNGVVVMDSANNVLEDAVLVAETVKGSSRCWHRSS